MADAEVRSLENKSTGMSRKSKPTDDKTDRSERSERLIEGLEQLFSLVGPAKEEISQLQLHINGHQDTVQLQTQLLEAKKENAELKHQITEISKKRNSDYDVIFNQLQQANAHIGDFENFIKKRDEELAEKQKEEIDAYKDVNRKTEELFQTTLKELEEKKSSQAKLILNYKKKLEDHSHEQTSLRVALQNMKKEKRKVEEELSDTKSRLSKLMGDKLSDNNPDIADLSDQNRPTKIGEKYQELYDNQWTDAYEVAENHFKDKEEKTRTRLLAKLLMDIYRFCQKEFDNQDKELMHALYRVDKGSDVLSDAVRKQIKEIKRHTAANGIKNITNRFIENADKTTELGNFTNKVYDFVHECVSVCWLMVLQDPPLAFHLGVKHGELFDSSRYKAYTATGTNFDFVVWPSLLLHQNGPVLSKGVAQCMSQYRGSQSARHRSRQVSVAEMGIPNGSVRLTRKETPLDPKELLQGAEGRNKNVKQTHSLEEFTSQMSDLKIKNTRAVDTVNQETSVITEKGGSNVPSCNDKRGQQTTECHHQSGSDTHTEATQQYHHNDIANSQQNPANYQPQQPTQQYRREAHMQFADKHYAAIPQQQVQIESSAQSQFNTSKQNESAVGSHQSYTTQSTAHAQWNNYQPQQQVQIESSAPSQFNTSKQNESAVGSHQTYTTQSTAHAQWNNYQPQQQVQIESTAPSQFNNFKQNESAVGSHQSYTTQSTAHAQWNNYQQNQHSTFQQPQNQGNNQAEYQPQPLYQYPPHLVPTQEEFNSFEWYATRYHPNSVRHCMDPMIYDKCKKYHDWLISNQYNYYNQKGNV